MTRFIFNSLYFQFIAQIVFCINCLDIPKRIKEERGNYTIMDPLYESRQHLLLPLQPLLSEGNDSQTNDSDTDSDTDDQPSSLPRHVAVIDLDSLELSKPVPTIPVHRRPSLPCFPL